MTDPTSTRRSFRTTPAWLIFGLLVVEGLLWLSERYRWFWFNEKKGWTVLVGVAVVGVTMLVMGLWFVVALVFRRRFQFSIRSLLVLTVAVAIPCSWLAVEMKAANDQREAAEAIEKLGGLASYDWQVDAMYTRLLYPEPPAPAMLKRVLGDDFFRPVVFVNLGGTQVANEELGHLKGLPELKALNLSNTRVSDIGFVHLAGLSQLYWLEIRNTRVADAGLENLRRLNRLHKLKLNRTNITDAGLESLKGLSQLEELALYDTKVTDVGVAKLQLALPNCRIER